MYKHIIGQGVYQLVILLILVFSGESFLPEYEDTLDSQILQDKNPLNFKYNIVGDDCIFLKLLINL